MAIEAQLADGRILEFPDGTDPSVIQSTVKKVLGVAQPQAEAPAATPAASVAPAPAASSILTPPTAQGKVESAADVLPDEEEADFSRIFPRQKQPFRPGEELVKGVKAGAASLKGMPSAFKLAGGSEALVDAKNRLDLLDKIDAGQIPSVRALREQPGFDPRVGSYFASSPEVRAKLRANISNELLKNKDFVKTALAAVQQYQKEAQQYRGRTEDLTDIRSATDFGNWLSKSMGEGAVQLAPLMLAAVVTKAPGVLALGTGMEFAGGVQNRMEFLAKEIKGLPEDQKLARVSQYLADTNDTTIAAAILSGSLDAVLGPAANAAKITAKNFAEFATRKGAAKAAAKRLPKEVGEEFLTGGAQEAVNVGAETRLGEEQNPLSLKTVKRIINAAAKEAAGAPAGTAVNVARAAAFTPPLKGVEPPVPPAQEEARIEPTMGETPTGAPAGTAAAPTTSPDARIEALTQEGLAVGLPEEDARARATDIVAAEEAKKQKALEPRIAELTQEYVDAGISPEEATAKATAQAQEEAAADEAAASEQARVGTANEPIAGATGEGVGVAGQPPTGGPAAGVGVSEPETVVPTGQAPAADVGGVGTQPGAVAPKGFENTPHTVDANGEIAAYDAGQGWRFTQRAVGQRVTFTDSGQKRTGIITEVNEAQRPNGQWAETLKVTDDDPNSASDENGNPVPERWTLGSNSILNVEPAITESATTEPTDGTQTTETQQAEAQGQEAPAAGAPAGVTPKKRGRPAVLTPEQKAQKQAEKAPAQALKARADRAITRLKKLLDTLAEPFDPSEYDSDEAAAEAEGERRAQKRDAIKELLTLQADASLRGTKVGTRVKELLNHPSITAKEKADIQAGIAAQQKAAEQVSRSTQGGAPADSRFNKFATGAQALSHIIKTGNAFQKMLGKRLRAFVANVKFVVIEEGDQLPQQLQSARNQREWDRARALYIENGITGEKVIYVRGASFGQDQGVNNVTVLHELLHAATNRKVALAMDALKRGVSLNDPLVRAAQSLLRTINSAVSTFNDMARAGTLPPEIVAISKESGGAALTDPREFIAYGMTDEAFQNFLMKARGYEEDTSFFNRFVTGVRRLFGMEEDTTNALSDLILVTDTILSSRAPKVGVFKGSVSASAKQTGEEERTQKEIEREFKVANEKFNQSKNGEQYAKGVSAIQMLQDPRKFGRVLRNAWNSFSYSARDAMARIAPTDFLADTFADVVPELRNTDVLMQKMRGMSLNLLKATGKLTSEVDRALRKDPTLQTKLDQITYVSTLMEVDPSDPNAKERSAKLDAMWHNLGPTGQHLYRRIKNHFEVLSDYFGRLLDEQITKSGLPIAEQSNLLQKVRAMYETGAKITPFFPLVRRGDFWLSIGSGKTRKFFMFETLAERDDAMRGFANERIKQKAGESDAAFAKRSEENLQQLLEDQEYTYGNDISTLRQISGDASEMLKGVFNAIDSAKLGEQDAKDALKDAVYQIYLQTMPEQSFRRQFIHRKGVTGFRTDVLRNTADASSRMAIQLARLKYGRLLRNSLSQARDSIINRPDYEPVVAAFERRVREELSPKPESVAEKIAGGLSKASFIWYLGAASSALLQPLSIIQTGIPVLAKYGPLKSQLELAKMFKVWDQFGVYEMNADGTTSFVMPTVEHAKGLTPEERRAVRAMLDYNLTTSTYANAVFDYKNTPTGNYSHPITKFGKDTVNTLVLGGLMHTTERISREVVFLTSFRLNRKAGKPYQEAIDQAVVDTKEALGNYGEYNRPEFMRGAVGKILTQFMMYPVHVTAFLIRNFTEMIKPMGGRTRTEAMSKFFGTLGTTFLLAGAAGLPMFSVVMGTLGWAWNKLSDDDEDKELRELDFELWFRTRWLPEQLGAVKVAGQDLAAIVERGVANAITGLDISSRTSLNNLWMRDTKENATMRDSAAALALEKAGPTANMVLSWAEAYEAFMQGDYSKGVKKALPAGFRNFVTAYEQWKEGAKDNKGAKILSKDAFTTGELIGQAIGFRSDALSNLQYATFKVIGLEQKINNERNLLLKQLDREFQKKDMKAFGKYMREINEFNMRHPSFAITDENVADTLETRGEQRAASYRGVTLTEKNIGLARALVPSRKAAAEKEKKGAE